MKSEDIKIFENILESDKSIKSIGGLIMLKIGVVMKQVEQMEFVLREFGLKEV